MLNKTQIMRIIFIGFFLLFTSTILKCQSQIELTFQWCDKYTEADKELNLVYQNIIKKYSKDTLFIKNLKKTQNNWIKLKESDKELWMPEDPNWYSAASMCFCQFKLDLTEKRTEFLKKWVLGPEERDGWICGFGAINNYKCSHIDH
jgi:uncharacterized protein YecT (DUF1311 family)